jgi:hypothetical protein
MSGALIWSDEVEDGFPCDLIVALRPIFAYRTSLMKNKPREEFRPIWDRCLKLFPNWVGFRPKRRQPTPQLLRVFREGDVGLRKCLRDALRTSEQKPPAK